MLQVYDVFYFQLHVSALNSLSPVNQEGFCVTNTDYWVDKEGVHPSIRAACRCIYSCTISSSCCCSASQLRPALQWQMLLTASAFYPHETRCFPMLLSSSRKYLGLFTCRSFASYLQGFFLFSGLLSFSQTLGLLILYNLTIAKFNYFHKAMEGKRESSNLMISSRKLSLTLHSKNQGCYHVCMCGCVIFSIDFPKVGRPKSQGLDHFDQRVCNPT